MINDSTESKLSPPKKAFENLTCLFNVTPSCICEITVKVEIIIHTTILLQIKGRKRPRAGDPSGGERIWGLGGGGVVGARKKEGVKPLYKRQMCNHCIPNFQ